ncbi:MAG TPA: protein ndvB, partial [Candidatus Tumulicola sp.]|nr:protein ndvB [Candidatus Tumulicola sp.]
KPGVIAINRRGQSSLWAYGISGDLPIVLLQLADLANIELARQLVQAHRYWRLFGLAADLVILGDDRDGQSSALQERITKLVAACGGTEHVDRPGGIFVRPAGKVSEDDRVLLQSAARVVINDADGSLAQQLERRGAEKNPTPTLPATRTGDPGIPAPAESPPPMVDRDPIFGNGLGGFTSDGREYVITIASGRMTPAPWINVLANRTFGTLISESGRANTWSQNAQQFRLTPWSNDPVGDANTEAFYLRDEESGRFWSPTLLPSGGTTPYVTRHGFGYSVFEHREEGIDSELAVYVAIDAPVKFVMLKLNNRSGRRRQLSVTGYLEWVLGDERSKTQMHVGTERDADSAALFAHNAYNTEFAGRIAFFDVDEMTAASVCGDRREFLGRNGTLRSPAAMSALALSGIVGAALDPCAAIRLPFDLAVGQTRELVFRLGAGASVDEARRLVRRWRGADAAREALTVVKRYWEQTLGAVQVETPERSLDLLANGWLVYQILACRLWARNAFYQSSGAFGFRDQLQDVMALVHAAPELVREHLLLCASRQFPEGDVQHWWHPQSGRGVRTRFSDDLVWLPYVIDHYVNIACDTGIFDVEVPYITMRELNPDEHEVYDLPKVSDQTGTIYDHCVRALRRATTKGQHGLPLIGSGDWNDGMNRVGIEGKGESVWLAWFLITTLRRFAEHAERRGDAAVRDEMLAKADGYAEAIERSAWDGEWYRRAYFDDGSPLGSRTSDE